jgi:hypothetical protein
VEERTSRVLIETPRVLRKAETRFSSVVWKAVVSGGSSWLSGAAV